MSDVNMIKDRNELVSCSGPSAGREGLCRKEFSILSILIPIDLKNTFQRADFRSSVAPKEV